MKTTYSIAGIGNFVKLASGITMIVAGVVLGIYVAGYMCLYGGLVDIITFIQNFHSAAATVLAKGILKVAFAGASGVISAVVLIVPGLGIIGTIKTSKRLTSF